MILHCFSSAEHTLIITLILQVIRAYLQLTTITEMIFFYALMNHDYIAEKGVFSCG